MIDAVRDVRGIAALIALVFGMTGFVALVLNGERDAADQVLALAATSLAYIIGLGSSPRPLDSDGE